MAGDNRLSATTAFTLTFAPIRPASPAAATLKRDGQRDAEREHASFRKALPAGFLKQECWNEAFYQEFSAKFQELMQKLTENNKMMEGMNLLAEEHRSKYAHKCI